MLRTKSKPLIFLTLRSLHCLKSINAVKLVPHIRRFAPLPAFAQPTRFTSSVTNIKIKSANLNNKDRKLMVKWSDGEEDLFSYIFLRDNCTCSDCFSESAQARQVVLENIDVFGTVADVHADDKGNSISMKWSDGHESQFNADWLRYRSFRPSARLLRNKIYGEEKVVWDRSFKVPEVDFDKIMNTDEELLEWLVKLDRYGLVLIKNTPLKVQQLSRLCDRVAFQRVTNYGPAFTVKSKIDPSNLAYTGATLPFHTDLPYYKNIPGIQFLHCIEQSKVGGENQFVDTRHIGKELKLQDPKAFDILSNSVIDYADIGTDYYTFHKVCQHKVINFDKFGEVESICCSIQTRDSYLNMDGDKVEPFYKAYKDLYALMYQPKNVVQFKMVPGDTITFDNRRVLHGRSKYQQTSDTDAGYRHLEGGYVDWDEVRSRIRVIRASLANK